MIMNALNGVLSDTYNLQIIIHQELEKLAKVLSENLIVNTKVSRQN